MEKELFKKGCEALSIGEWEMAKEFLEKARKVKETPEVLEKLGWAYWWLNDPSAVFDYRKKAYQLFLDKNDNPGASRNASWIGADYLEFKNELAIASGWFKRAENLLEGLEPTWELGLIKILKARLIYMVERNSEAALKLIDESLELCRSLKSVDGEMIAEGLKGFILVFEGNISEGMPLLDEATVLAITNEKSDIHLSTIACCFLIDACERIRDYERAGQWCSQVKEICKRWRYKAMFAHCRMKHAGVLIWKGDWKEAEEELLTATQELKEFRPIQVYGCTLRLGDLRRRQGRWNEAESLLSSVQQGGLKHIYMAELLFDKGEYDEALEIMERYIRRISVKEKTERVPGIELLIRIYLKLNRIEDAQILFNELKEISESINTILLRAALLNAEGCINFTKNNCELAKHSFENAVDIYDEIKSPYESSRTRLMLGEVLIKLGQYAQADAELNEAAAKFKELGAERDFEKAKYLLKNLHKDSAGNEYQNKYEFTGRELEVLRLIAEGKNNEEIAEKLFLSVRTVEKHITNIYSKMGISGKSARAYVASYAIKHNLILT